MSSDKRTQSGDAAFVKFFVGGILYSARGKRYFNINLQSRKLSVTLSSLERLLMWQLCEISTQAVVEALLS